MAFYIKCISGKDTAGFTTTGFYLDSSGQNNKQSFSSEADARNAIASSTFTDGGSFTWSIGTGLSIVEE